MATQTLIIVVGGDYLAYEICREILKTPGQRVVLVWKHDEERAARLLARTTARFRAEFPDTFAYYALDPADIASLRQAGLEPPGTRPEQPGYCIVAVSQDDRLNLRVALLARDINDRTRVTIRQFNPSLGRKIQEGLKYDCVAISPAAHAAATYAAAAVDPSCFYALPFPERELFGFSERDAADFAIAGLTVAAAEARLRARVVAVDGRTRAADEVIPAAARVCVFGPIANAKRSWPRGERHRGTSWPHWAGAAWRDLRVSLRRTEPILRTVFGLALLFYLIVSAYFAAALHINPIVALYFVMATMTTVGYGDITPCAPHCATQVLALNEVVALLVAMLTMLAGVTIFAVLTATVTSALSAATARRTQGLRRVHRSGHVIVCGAGNVGSLVIEYLHDLGEDVVVVEKNPNAILIELARDRKIDLLSGDATNDETIAYCSPERAKAIVSVTNSDTANIEVALGARTRMREHEHSDAHVVLRIDDLLFGASIKRQFGLTSFSTTELTAPTIAGLAQFESTRGRIDVFNGRPFARAFELAERIEGEGAGPPPSPHWIPLYAWREQGAGNGVAIPVHTFGGDVRLGDRLLFLIPLDQFDR